MPFVHENVKVELFPGTPSPIVYLSENDVGDTIAFELVYKGQPVNIPDGSIVKFKGTKKDGLGFTVNLYSVSGNVVNFIVSEDMTSCPGVVEAEISIMLSNNKHGTCNVVLIVEKNPHSDGTQDGSYPQIVSEMRALVNQIEGDAEAAVNAKNISLQIQQDVHQYTASVIDDWLDEHPEATTTVQDGAITYPKLNDSLKLIVNGGCATPEMYGGVGDGITDDSTAINAILADKKTLYLPYGKSYFCASDIETPTDGSFSIIGGGTILLDDASVVLQNYLQSQTRDLPLSILSGIRIRELKQDSLKPCIHIKNGSRINIYDIIVYDGFYGIKIDTGLGINIHDIRIDNSFVDGESRVGLYIDAGDSAFTNIVIREYKTGMETKSGSNFFYKVHPWIENMEQVYPNSIAYKLGASRGAVCDYFAAYLDSYETPIYKTGLCFEKFYGVKILNHPSNTIKHPIFTSVYPQARISFDTISLGYQADDYFEIPKNCFFDNINGFETTSNKNFSQITLANGLEGELYGRLTNAGLVINGRFTTSVDIATNTPVILFNNETSSYSFNLMSLVIRCESGDGTGRCYLQSNYYSQIRSLDVITANKTYYINAVIPLINRI